MPNPTMTLMASTTVGAGGAATVVLSNILQTYKDIKIIVAARSDNASNRLTFAMTFNGGGYTQNRVSIYNEDGAKGSENQTNNQVMVIPGSLAQANYFTHGEIYIPNYTSSNNKTFGADSNMSFNSTTLYDLYSSALYANTTSPITSITFAASAGNIVQNSTFHIYGIKED